MSLFTRRSFLRTTAAGTAGVLFSGLSNVNAAETKRPNILWITAEDLSPFLGCYGDSYSDTPNLDKLASEGVRYENAFANVPVCAPARFTLISGVYANSAGCQHMRSRYERPAPFAMYPDYLRKAGYFCTNNSKTDYNTTGDWNKPWHQCSKKAHYKNRPSKATPFFAIFNLTICHEHCIFRDPKTTQHDPSESPLPPYHPDLPEIRKDWAEQYDHITKMDDQVGRLLRELDESGHADDTIVFFYGDHGGILPRSKRFLFDSGTRVPLLIRFPKKYQSLSPGKPGSRIERPVSFIDIPPTLLSLAGVPIPDHYQGIAFLGEQKVAADPDYIYTFRGRMDERYDMMRGVRGRRYLYIRNYMPHRIWGQHLNYLWKAQSTRAWETAYKAGECNKLQSRFWEKKPPEELYECKKDPWSVHNLAEDPAHKAVLEKMRQANRTHVMSIRDTGFLPEGELVRRAAERNCTHYELLHDNHFPLETIVETAELATFGKQSAFPELLKRLKHEDSGVRYWAATGCIILGKKAEQAAPQLEAALNDPSPDVALAAAEALYTMGKKQTAREAIASIMLKTENGKAQLHAVNILQSVSEHEPQTVKAVQKLSKTTRDGYVKRATQYYVECFG